MTFCVYTLVAGESAQYDVGAVSALQKLLAGLFSTVTDRSRGESDEDPFFGKRWDAEELYLNYSYCEGDDGEADP